MSFVALAILALNQTPADDAKKLQGEWWCSALTIDGRKIKLSTASKPRLTLDGKEFRQTTGGEELLRLRYAVLPGGVLRFDVPGEDGVSFFGWYELKGDKLRVCYPGPLDDEKGAIPPAALESRTGSKVTLSTWERVRE